MSIGAKIVLIEDDQILSDALYGGLVEAGFDVERAFDGMEGHRLVQKNKPDLVLLDLLLPKMDGFAVARMLKSAPETKAIPIIVLSVLEKMAPIAAMVESGVDGYLVKADFRIEDIVKMVRTKLGGVVK